MTRSRPARFDSRSWRSGIARRLDRRSLAIAVAYAALGVALWLLNKQMFDGFVVVARELFQVAAFYFASTMATLVILAVALVAVARGVSRWVAYPMVAGIVVIGGLGYCFASDPFGYFLHMRNPQWAAPAYLGSLAATLVLPAVFYVYQSNAVEAAGALRRLEIERGAEAERVAHERLQAQLATIDHDLVLAAMRLALAAPAAPAEGLLAAVSNYLRAAQQRDAADPASVAAALGELRGICASRADAPARGVVA